MTPSLIWWKAVAQTCPSCGDVDVHHSRPRSPLERFRRRLTGRVPFRCHHCAWRGWRREVEPGLADAERPIERELTESELERLDPGARGEGK
jgi:hypothetical protein